MTRVASMPTMATATPADVADTLANTTLTGSSSSIGDQQAKPPAQQPAAAQDQLQPALPGHGDVPAIVRQPAAPRNIASFMVCGTRFDVDARYSLIKPIGQGAYGVVWYACGLP